jgi:hypothetical protein
MRPKEMSPFAQSLCQAQISILEILYIFLRLKFSPSLTLAKIEHFFLKVPVWKELDTQHVFPE